MSNAETISLISSMLDSKLQKSFVEFKRSCEDQEHETLGEVKKLKSDSKASTSIKFKRNRLQFEFNNQILDCLNAALRRLSEGQITLAEEEILKAKKDVEKRIKLDIRIADKSPAGWAAVEEYQSDELAEDSEDEKKLRSAERRVLSKIKLKSTKARNSKFNKTNCPPGGGWRCANAESKSGF